jgi:methylmalonyl-CoA mutase cobalamin-binding subunit
MAAALVFIFSHGLQIHGVRSTQVVVGPDVDDAKATQQGESGFDAYFTKANPIPDRTK